MSEFSDALPDSNAYAAMKAAEVAEREAELVVLREKLQNLSEGAPMAERAGLQLRIASTLAFVERGAEAWPIARAVFDAFVEMEDWESAVEACDVLYLSEQEGSVSALGQGVWLGVTFPIDPELTVAMLDHIIDDTPDDADGAAVAAATAVYVADLRADGDNAENIQFFARQMLGKVARRHSEIDSQEQFDLWMSRMELDDPAKFLVRLRNVVDVLVQDDWWVDRDSIRNKLPH